MKKLLLFSLMFAFSVVTAHAYAPKRKANIKAANQKIMGNLKFGINIGQTTSRFSNDFTDEEHSKYKPENFVHRLHAGIFGEYKFMKELGAQVAFSYVGKGNKHSSRSLLDYLGFRIPSDEKKFHLNYLQSTATLRYYPGQDRQFGLLIGAYISYLMTAKKITKDAFKTEYKEFDLKEEETKDTLQNIDTGIVFGLDYEFDMALILGFDCNIGLRPVFKEEKCTNYVLSLNLGYNFAKLLK